MAATEDNAVVEVAAKVLIKTLRADIQEQLKCGLSQCPNDHNAEFRLEGSIYVPGTTSHEASGRILLCSIDAQELRRALWHTGEDLRDDRPMYQYVQFSDTSRIPVGLVTPSLSVLAEYDAGTDDEHYEPDPPAKRRKLVGGLRPVSSSKHNVERDSESIVSTPDSASSQDEISRQLQSDGKNLPQRKKPPKRGISREPCSANKLIAGIWKTIFGSIKTSQPSWLESSEDAEGMTTAASNGRLGKEAFQSLNKFCLKVSKLSRSTRALETIVQAHWVDCFEARISAIAEEKKNLSATETRMAGLTEACATFGWTEKELRNRILVWRGYKEIKDAGGWVSLIFAGAGVYRTCKYRIGFEADLLQRLSKLQRSLEVAADTLHPEWRGLLAAVNHETPRQYHGHPHDWVVSADHDPIPLASTYVQWDPEFSFKHLEECQLDDIWCGEDPRRVATKTEYACAECGQYQSMDPKMNRCSCFPICHGHAVEPAQVQIIRCLDGKNNGLITRRAFERGSAIGEFVGLVTQGIEGVDVMVGGYNHQSYQIYQGRMGNYTRFINHSCKPNCQFQKFIWLGVERIVVVSKGIQADTEVTVDYSSGYWKNLEKICLCGERCCRYREKSRLGS
ncbi:MAG: hypothetical protein M1830_000082 [Pleopsidium flavum]|nr:MAG: hypothetical protein M1830_000082 [Pleopsidium flavum]